MNTSKLFRLNWRDLLKGLATAVLSAVVLYLANLMKVPGFDLATIPVETLIQVMASAGLAYLVKNFFSDEEGKLAGVL